MIKMITLDLVMAYGMSLFLYLVGLHLIQSKLNHFITKMEKTESSKLIYKLAETKKAKQII